MSTVNVPGSDARSFRYEDISLGMKAERDYLISPGVYDAFLAAFDDRSPVHVDEAYAKAAGFTGRVMHGALLNGFLSHFVGMYFPGRLGLLLGADLRYAQPSYLGDVIHVEATVSQKMDAQRVIVLDMRFENTTQKWTAARGRVQVQLREVAG